MSQLHFAEVPYEDGTVRFRYARKMAPDGARWIRHGLFTAFHPNGVLASEGTYSDGQEHGLWTDYHDNGQKAAQGHYAAGSETGAWSYWSRDGALQLEPQNDT